MGIIRLPYAMHSADGKTAFNTLSRQDFAKFNPGILGLGDIAREGESIEALAAMYDLEGFTSFCGQDDSHLIVQDFLKMFLDWLFAQTARSFTRKIEGDQVLIWGRLPFFAKFLGDGVLFLWDTNPTNDRLRGPHMMGAMILALLSTCLDYQREFLPLARQKFANTPQRLRCGIARGRVISIGDGQDFVGPCINLASRLQKLSPLSFAISAKGIDIEKALHPDDIHHFVPKRVKVRGLQVEQLVYVLADEMKKLSAAERDEFQAP
jgi:class 3 adenylate cyclase